MPTANELIRRVAERCSTHQTRHNPGEEPHTGYWCDFCDARLVQPEAENTAHKDDCPIMGLQLLIVNLTQSVVDKVDQLKAAKVTLDEAYEDNSHMQDRIDELADQQ